VAMVVAKEKHRKGGDNIFCTKSVGIDTLKCINCDKKWSFSCLTNSEKCGSGV